MSLDTLKMLSTEEGREEVVKIALSLAAPSLHLLAIYALTVGNDPDIPDEDINEAVNIHLKNISTSTIAGLMAFSGLSPGDAPREHKTLLFQGAMKAFVTYTQERIKTIAEGPQNE